MKKTKKLTFFTVNDDYIDYLREKDNKVLFNKPDNERRPYVGFVLDINNSSYLVPLTSKVRPTNKITTRIPNTFTQKQMSEPDFDTKYPKYVGSIKFNCMIPVFDEVITKIDLDKLSETEEGRKYTDLLNKEIVFCNNNKDSIVSKALKTYEMCEKNKKYEAKLIEACCDFKLLEAASMSYKDNILKSAEVALDMDNK